MGRRGRQPYPDLLTPRQQQVLTLVREGLTNREIAERLDITPDGVKFHVSEILTKIGVRSREEAARWRTDTPSALIWHGGRPSLAVGAWYSRWGDHYARPRINSRMGHARTCVRPRCQNHNHNRKLSIT